MQNEKTAPTVTAGGHWGWHLHTDLHLDGYGRSSFHQHDGLPPHQHQADNAVVFHFTALAPPAWGPAHPDYDEMGQ